MHVGIVTARGESFLGEVARALEEASVSWSEIVTVDPAAIFADGDPDVLMVDMIGPLARAAVVREIVKEARRDRLVPVLALIPRSDLSYLDLSLGLDDFTLLPVDAEEMIVRLRLLQDRYHQGDQKNDVIQIDDLRIDLSRYEVWVGSRQVTLTFKEYELLKLLASEPRRVFTREILLNQVWGYDYFGGTRTVDVHVRRLRSKLEDPTHTFVETVRNVGYRIRVAA